MTLLEIKNLSVEYKSQRGILGEKETIHAVNNLSLDIKKGEILAVAGESGCGKSTLAKAIILLEAASNGEIIFDGKNILQMQKAELKEFRKKAQMVFQNPYASLNPKMKIFDTLKEPLKINTNLTDEEIREKVEEIMEVCGLPSYYINRYPHEFSGGQRQRIGIARALVLDPQFVICDEPVSALDVSIQSQIINLLGDLQKERNFSYIFISHDLSVVEYISNRVAVMYLGNIVELADKNEIFDNPLHPYTKALMSAIPVPDPTRKRERIILSGDLPSPSNPPSGCKFRTRCPMACDKCAKEAPEYRDIGGGHFVACHLV